MNKIKKWISNWNLLAIIISLIVLVVSLIAGAITDLKLVNDRFWNSILVGMISTLVITIFQWCLYHLIFLKRTILFWEITRILNEMNFDGISSRENSGKIDSFDIYSYKSVQEHFSEYNRWTYPIENMKFKVKFFLTYEVKLIYILRTSHSSSISISNSIKKMKELSDSIKIDFDYKNTVFEIFKKEMKNKDGISQLIFDRKSKSISFFSYGRKGYDKPYQGFIFGIK